MQYEYVNLRQRQYPFRPPCRFHQLGRCMVASSHESDFQGQSVQQEGAVIKIKSIIYPFLKQVHFGFYILHRVGKKQKLDLLLLIFASHTSYIEILIKDGKILWDIIIQGDEHITMVWKKIKRNIEMLYRHIEDNEHV